MTHHVNLLAVLLSVVVSSCGQVMQASTSEQERMANVLKGYVKETDPQGSEKTLEIFGIQAFPCQEEQSDELARKACLAARKAYYDYYAAGLARRTKVYEWNNFSTRVIFFTVLSLVGIGVYFSWKQFFGAARKAAAAGSETPPEGREAEVTELEAGIQGIRVKSPILGVILLTLSLAFFYLYLVHVYPVTEHF